MLEAVYTSDPVGYFLWNGGLGTVYHPELITPPRLYTEAIAAVLGMFVRPQVTLGAEAVYHVLAITDTIYSPGWNVVQWTFDAVSGEQISETWHQGLIALTTSQIGISPYGHVYRRYSPETIAEMDPLTFAEIGPLWEADHWTDGASTAITVSAFMIDPIADLALLKTSPLNSNTQISVHRLSTGETIRKIGVAGFPATIVAETPGTCYVVATNGVVTVLDYLEGQILGVFKMPIDPASPIFDGGVAWDPVYRRLLVFEHVAENADGSAATRIYGYRPLPLPVALTPPLPIKAPRLGRTVPVIVRAYGDAGEGVSGIRIGAVETGAGTLLSAAEPTDELGWATMQETCGATGTSQVDASTTV
jgi:hypothetical protein